MSETDVQLPATDCWGYDAVKGKRVAQLWPSEKVISYGDARAAERDAHWAAEVEKLTGAMLLCHESAEKAAQAANPLHELNATLAAERDSAQAEAKRNAKDAERYRWLRDSDVAEPCYVVRGDGSMNPMPSDEMDAAIDAAMQPGAQP